LRQIQCGDLPRLVFVFDHKGAEQELVFQPRQRQTHMHAGSQLRGVYAGFTAAGGMVFFVFGHAQALNVISPGIVLREQGFFPASC
jgi:hypothetical protein